MSENNISSNDRVFHGRRTIYTDVQEINENNVVSVLNDAIPIHTKNRIEIDYLYNYYKGEQPILHRKKDIRPEICNKLMENRANEIVSFKTGYLMGEPVQYINRSEESGNSEALNQLNDYVYIDNKNIKDKLLADWFHICGIAYKLVMPNRFYDANSDEEESPFCTYVLDPRNAFVIRVNDITQRVIAGVKYVIKRDNTVVYSVYTSDAYYEIINDNVVDVKSHDCGSVPIVEYSSGNAKLGAFEIVLPILDAINRVESNRVDAVEQFVQALLVLVGVDMGTDDFKNLIELGGLKVPLGADVKYLVQELNQQQSQTLKDDMYETVLTICGMPNRNGGTSTSDTGKAVIMRDGWSAAEARAKDSEEMYKSSEKEALKIMLRICRRVAGNVNIKLSSINIRFTRRNFENILEKAQVLTMMLGSDKIDPSLAFAHCGMFVDSELAYTLSKKYIETTSADAEVSGFSSSTEPPSA